MINYFLILFIKKSILIKNKIINSLFKSNEKKIIDENKIDPTSSHILKHYTNDQNVQLEKSFLEALY